MVTEREKKLLDYLEGVGQRVRNYMRRNGYSKDSYQSISIDVIVDADGPRYDSVKTYYSTSAHGKDLRLVKRDYDIIDQAHYYKVIGGEDDERS